MRTKRIIVEVKTTTIQKTSIIRVITKNTTCTAQKEKAKLVIGIMISITMSGAMTTTTQMTLMTSTKWQFLIWQ